MQPDAVPGGSVITITIRYTESGQTLQRSFSAVSKPIFASKYSLVTRCCAKEERQRGSDEVGKAEKKARRAGEEEESGKRRGGL